MVIKSWTNEEMLEDLAQSARFGEIVNGVVRSTDFMNLPKVNEDGTVSNVEEETLIIALPGGITGYCPSSEFMEREFRSLRRFVGTTQQFVITRLDLDHEIALLSEKQAAAKLRETFWEEITYLNKTGQLENEIFDATVSGYNQKKGNVYVRINGQDAFMFRRDWAWAERGVVDAQQGETIQVKIEQFDEDQKLVRVSRKKALPDPKDFITKLKRDQIIAGRVSHVDPIHGLYVEVETDVVLKAGKISRLEEPTVGDIVTCRVRSTNPEERKGKVIIIDYPRGKRKKKDLGSFLFE